MKMKRTLKRMLSCILAAAIAVPAAVPSNSLAAANNELKHGDANGDGSIDLRDALAVTQYIKGNEPSGFQKVYANVNEDAEVDASDLLKLKQYLAEWNISLDPGQLTVSFYDGDRLIDSLQVERGMPAGEIPSVGKSSKANAILLGYYTDKDCTEPFYANNPVTQDMKVYAKYKEMGGTEELNLTSFAQMDQSPDLSFEIWRKSGTVDPKEAAILIVKDGSDPVELSIEDPDGDGIYTVKAVDGFLEGCSYELMLADGWAFYEKEDTIRTAAFSIAMEEVENLEMNENIIYIQDTPDMDYTVADGVYEELEPDMAQNGGSFVYDGQEVLKADDILCIYVGTNPMERDPKNGSELLDPAAYVKVTAVNGSEVSFEPLGSEDQIKLYNIPDNFPICVEELPAEDTGNVTIDGLDRDMYALMMGEEDGTYDNALEKLAVGDFVTLYTSKEAITESEDNLYYGRITAYDSSTGEITYEKTSKEAILNSMDLYSKLQLSGDDLITEEEKEELEQILQAQVEQSNFAEEAAYILSDMVTKTDGFRENMKVKDFLLSDEDGNPLSEEEIRLLNIGSSFELSDDIKLSVELITSGDQLHFGDGVQLAIKIDANFEVEAAEGKVAIELSATFVEEVAVNPMVRGGIVKKEILGIPIPVGVEVSATIDVKNYTAFSFAAEIYTIAEEDKNVWEKIQSICKDPTEVLGLPGIPDKFKNGLKTVGDVMDKIDELKKKIDEAAETTEQIKGYMEDMEALWDVVEQTGLTTEEDWKQMGETLGKTSIASDLLELMDMTTETEISAEYLDSMQELMNKYSEMLEKETDWIKLVDKEITSAEVVYLGFVIGVEVNFIVRADMSIAIGSNLEYEVGKRYNFWFKIGLFKPTAGSSTMDLLDEKFAFQFYVMGKLGLKAGVRAKLYVGIGSGKFASVGIAAELGPYIKLYGFFVYEYTKYRPAGTQSWTSKERMAGALYLEFGLYFMLGFEANALGNLFEYSYDFLDEEIPLLTAGEARYYYDTAYEAEEDESVIVRDEDGNSTNGITMVVPDSVIALSYVDLDTGFQGSEALDYSRYNYMVSDPNFKVDPSTGVISVMVPENTRYMECDLTITYLYGKLSFSQYDMSVTVPLVWTNLSTEELSEYYTASVRIGNDIDGYQTIWRKRVLKNQQYDLPTDAEVREMIGWNDAKYIESTGYGSQQTTGLTLIEDTVYDYQVDYREYSVTVEGIQNADGTTRSAVYTAKYGERFDFSDLEQTGISKENETYTKFAKVTTAATIAAGGEKGTEEVIDLTQRIGGKMADALLAGVQAQAEYVDDTAAVIFIFTGIAHDEAEQRLRKGTTPSLTEIDAIVGSYGQDIVDVSPKLGRVYSPMIYQIICGELPGPKATITFEENGGSDVLNLTKTEGGHLGSLPVPVRQGYSFGGWYTDNETFVNAFAEERMPNGGAVLYAKWTANTYTVTFHENGGNELAAEEKTKTVTYDSAYEILPVPTRSGFVFIGWFTAADKGTEITAETTVSTASNQTFYAHWRQLKDIPTTVFDFGEAEGGVYQKGTVHEVFYTFDAGEESFTEDSFTFKYMRQGNSEYETGLPINAGTYNVTISRPADNIYAKFEYTYTAVITIDKAVRTIEAVEIEAEDLGYTYMKLRLVGDGGIDDLSDEAALTYQAKRKITQYSWITQSYITKYVLAKTSADRDSYIYDLSPNTYYITVKVTDDPNYEDAESTQMSEMSTLSAPKDYWITDGNYNTAWYDDHQSEESFTLENEKDLAGLAYLVNYKRISFSGKTITLAADLDMRGHRWSSISGFEGIFDGGNHKITGVYMNTSSGYVGLFGSLTNAQVRNILLDHSYINGNTKVGGIAGYASGNTLIDNCVNFAKVYSDDSRVGGIVGECNGGNVTVNNCVNYGYISGGNEESGGIAGFVNKSQLHNNANYGKVTGSESDVGGIVGQNDKNGGATYNSINVGRVIGPKAYTGAIIGRNEKDKGSVRQVYYLQGSATGDGGSRNAAGNSKGSDADNHEHVEAAYFTSPTSRLSRSCEGYKTDNLITALNEYVRKNKSLGVVEWVATGWKGYPLPKNSPIPDAMLTRVEQNQ